MCTFKIGDNVICRTSSWVRADNVKDSPKGPIKGEILKIKSTLTGPKGLYLGFPEYYDHFNSKGFEKLVSDTDLLEYRVTVSEPELNPVKIKTPLEA